MADHNINLGSSLFRACIVGNHQVVEEYLSNGFDVNLRDCNGKTLLFWSCLYGWEVVIRLLLSRGADVNTQDNSGLSALMIASGNGHNNTVEILTEKGAEVNIQNSNGWSALMIASQNEQSNTVKILSRKGAEVNMPESKGWSALMIASQNGHSKTVEILIENGAEVNMRDNDSWSALMIASENGQSNTVKILSRKGAEVNMRESKGWSALMIASQNGHSKTVEILIEKGAEVNMHESNGGGSALMIASRNGHSNTVEILIEKGAEVNMQNSDGLSALMIACQNGHNNTVEILIEKGAEVNMQNSDGFSALMIASENGHNNTVEILIEKGAKVNMQNSDGFSALMIASQNGHIDIVKVFIAQSAVLDMQSYDGWSALMISSKYGHKNVVKELLEQGTKINLQKTNDGSSALILASENGHCNVATLLIENGAEVNMPNKDGCTALMMACRDERNNEVVQVLIDNHADTSIRNKDGKTAYDWARMRGHAKLYNLVFIASSSPTQKNDITTDSTSESPSPGFLSISANSSLADQEQHDHFTNTSENCTEVSLKELYMELDTVTDIIKLGVGLGVPQHQLDIIISKNPPDVKQQKFDVLSFIAENSTPLRITWERIADNLEQFMDMGNLAQDIRRKFAIDQHAGTEGKLAIENIQCISDDLILFTDQVIGGGAFGVVFRGEFDEQPCAIKVLHAVATELQSQLPTANYTKKESLTRFRKECEFLESFDHPNIVHHLATREHPKTGQLVLALELMDTNLRHYFTTGLDRELVKLALPVQSSLCENIASALEYIHSRGVVHRDLCGENILLSCVGEFPIAKVCDFGMSRITKSDTQSVSLQAFAHKGFMPPEAIHMESSRYNSSFDIYSFGALMVQVVRHLPTIKDRRERNRELEHIQKDHPLKNLILECLNENRDDRPSAAYLKRRLCEIFNVQRSKTCDEATAVHVTSRKRTLPVGDKGPSEKKPRLDTDLTLTVDDTMTVFEVLDEARQNWYFIGVGFGCKESDLDEIQTTYSTDQRRCFEMLKGRIRQGGLTCSILCNSLRGKLVRRDDIAKKIEALLLSSHN